MFKDRRIIDELKQRSIELEAKNRQLAEEIHRIKQKNAILDNEIDTLKRAIEVKDEFLSTISHELKTPLTVINSAVQIMEINAMNKSYGKFLNHTAIIKRNVFRQLRLVNNLLDITRINAGKMSIQKKNHDIVFLTRSITESVTEYAKMKDLSLDFKTEFDEVIIGIDEEKYERIMLNLLSNAIKFTPAKKAIEVGLCKKDDKVCIHVRDEGIGIPADKQHLIFNRFNRIDNSLSRNAEGTGIGLNLVKSFVEILDGEIKVKSQEGKGSTFTVILPERPAQEDECEKQYRSNNDRLIDAHKIEFSDIYPDY